MKPEDFKKCLTKIHSGDMQSQDWLRYYFNTPNAPKSKAGKLKNSQKKEAFKQLKTEAAKNNGHAMAFLAYFYLNGWGTRKNLSQCVNTLKQALQLNNPLAQELLGDRYLNEEGVRKDYKEAFHYFKLSADQKYPGGYYGLYWMYRNHYGETDIKDRYAAQDEAKKWLHLAASNGVIAAMHRVYHGDSKEGLFDSHLMCPFRYYMPNNKSLHYRWEAESLRPFMGTIRPWQFNMIVEYVNPNNAEERKILVKKVVTNHYIDFYYGDVYKHEIGLCRSASRPFFAQDMADAVREADKLLSQYLEKRSESSTKVMTNVSSVANVHPQSGAVTLMIERLTELLNMASTKAISIPDIIQLAQASNLTAVPGTVTLTIERLTELLNMSSTKAISIPDILQLAQISNLTVTQAAPVGGAAVFKPLPPVPPQSSSQARDERRVGELSNTEPPRPS